MFHFRFLALVVIFAGFTLGLFAEAVSPKVIRISPLGGQQGKTLPVEILGEFLSNTTSVEFDCQDLVWTRTTDSSSGKLRGIISILPKAPLGPHVFRVLTLDGHSNSVLFGVGQFPSTIEVEPNDRLDAAQAIVALPAEIYGSMDGAEDVDLHAIQVRAGERWTFDLESTDYGSGLEAKMILMDSAGRTLAYNDDRDDFDETPFIEYTFRRAGKYYIKLDQYRGPRGFGFGKNSTYILRISALPQIVYASPLGARVGFRTRIQLSGVDLDKLQSVYLTQIRRGEYFRMTFPVTIPVHFGPDPPAGREVPRIEGKIISQKRDHVEVEVNIPEEVKPGLWRIWGSGLNGVSEGLSFEIAQVEEYDELTASKIDWKQSEYVINGSLSRPSEKDVYRIEGEATRSVHFWTLARQIGISNFDSVLQLRDASGKKLAENDDVVPGLGTLIGNSDSSLFYTPEHNGPLFLVVKDRMERGGPEYQYRLKVKNERPGFQLFSTPENLAVPRGGSNEMKVQLIRESNLKEEVTVWIEGAPFVVEPARQKFRADQLFEPGADSTEMIIPEMTFKIHVPPSVQVGTYQIRILGVRTEEEESSNRTIVEGQTCLAQGPLVDPGVGENYVRRPMPQISLTVYEPAEGRLTFLSENVNLKRGESTTVELKAEKIGEDVPLQIMNLPKGVTYRLIGRQADQMTFSLEASADAPLGSFDFSFEARLRNRRASTKPVSLSILPASKASQAANNRRL